MDINSETELDWGYLRDDNFKVTKDDMDLLFSVVVDIEYKMYRPDYGSPPEYEVKKSHIKATLKEAWKGEERINLSAKEESALEEELEKQLEKMYID